MRLLQRSVRTWRWETQPLCSACMQKLFYFIVRKNRRNSPTGAFTICARGRCAETPTANAFYRQTPCRPSATYVSTTNAICARILRNIRDDPSFKLRQAMDTLASWMSSSRILPHSHSTMRLTTRPSPTVARFPSKRWDGTLRFPHRIQPSRHSPVHSIFLSRSTSAASWTNAPCTAHPSSCQISPQWCFSAICTP